MVFTWAQKSTGFKMSENGTDLQTVQVSAKGFVAKPGTRQMILKHEIKNTLTIGPQWS